VLLIVTVGLVIVALVLLIFGFADNSLVYIYLSILCSVVAAVVLTICTRLSRRRALRLAGSTGNDLFDQPVVAGEPSAASVVEQKPDEQPPASRPPEAATSVTHAVPPQPHPEDTSTSLPPGRTSQAEAGKAAPGEPSGSAGSAVVPPSDETGQLPTRPQPAVGRELPPRADDAPEGPVGVPAETRLGWEDGDWDDEEVVFPIADYDSLRVPEILPLLGELDANELEEVRAREVTGRARGTLIKRIDMLLASFSAVPEGASEPAAPVRPLHAETAGPRAQSETAEPLAHPESAELAAEGGRAEAFPIPEYDRLRPSEILPRLSELNQQQLNAVAAHERESFRRRTILVRISRLQADPSGGSGGNS
jgi:hypothetical protein